MPNDIHAGTPPTEWEGWESASVHFHNFADLPSKKGDYSWSPSFTCLGSEWVLNISPGGHQKAKEGKVSLHLYNASNHEMSVEFGLSIKGNDNGVEITRTCREKFSPDKDNWGWPDYTERTSIMESLKHGTLTVHVRIKPDGTSYCKNFIPRNPFMQSMTGLFLDEDTADVSFEVKGKLFHAHKLVLNACAKGSILASLCEDSDSIPIADINPEVFRYMLLHVYGGMIPASAWKDHSKLLIEAADKYGLGNLKVEAEAWHVKYLNLTVDEVVEVLAYAEQMNCFLLKEAAIDFIVENADEVLTSDSIDNIPESKFIIREIMFAIASKNKDKKSKKEGKDLTKLSINSLRARLHMNGDDFDGQRETLIARLKK